MTLKFEHDVNAKPAMQPKIPNKDRVIL
jgi:hypothetical protein